MAHGALKRGGCREGKGIGSRRIFAPHFKLQVLDSYRNDADCKGNQRATARKYGIHRRQIQKWLQVEPHLRSSIKGREEGPRLPPDAEARVPALSPAAPPAPPDPAPMDLSLKRPAAPTAPADRAPSPPRVPAPHSLPLPHPDVWDLSVKRREPPADAPKPPVKLFKPYLDDVEDAPRAEVPPCCSAAFNCDAAAYYYNNNNICDVKCEYTTYTLHELQPKNSLNYYYYPPAYQSDYEMGPFYDEAGYGQGGGPLKQRHSYSLDFKLSAIECYYQDSVCKGNQRAVATKYNIHRRQVQKWLKQADELKQKNENIKQTTVR